jgi:hypothetical protein
LYYFARFRCSEIFEPSTAVLKWTVDTISGKHLSNRWKREAFPSISELAWHREVFLRIINRKWTCSVNALSVSC